MKAISKRILRVGWAIWLGTFAWLVGPSFVAAQELKWSEDMALAQSKAKEEDRWLLVDFTGSDWCPACINLEKDVLDQTAFKDFAEDSLVLVRVDFPRRKEQSANQKKANNQLARHFKVEAFPTLILLDAEGKEVKRFVGYQSGGADALVKELKAAMKTSDQ